MWCGGVGWNNAALHLLDIRKIPPRDSGLERGLGRSLPAAVAEWFRAGADRRLAQLGGNNITTAASLGGPDHVRFLDAGLLLLETDNQRCCRWVTPLDAGDDPAVYLVDPEDFTGASRTVYAASFTAYTEADVWDALLFRTEDAVRSFDHALRPDALRTLDDRLDRRPSTYGWARNQGCDVVHRFDGPARVAIAVTGSTAVRTITASPSADPSPGHRGDSRGSGPRPACGEAPSGLTVTAGGRPARPSRGRAHTVSRNLWTSGPRTASARS